MGKRLSCKEHVCQEGKKEDFPGGPVVKNPSANAGDTGLNHVLGRFHMTEATKAI